MENINKFQELINKKAIGRISKFGYASMRDLSLSSNGKYMVHWNMDRLSISSSDSTVKLSDLMKAQYYSPEFDDGKTQFPVVLQIENGNIFACFDFSYSYINTKYSKRICSCGVIDLPTKWIRINQRKSLTTTLMDISE